MIATVNPTSPGITVAKSRPASDGVVYVRYWGSHPKSSRQVQMIANEFKPMLSRGWQCRLVLERVGDSVGVDPLKELGISLDYLPRPKSSIDPASVFRAFKYFRQCRATVMQCDNIHLVPLIGAWFARVPLRFWRKRAMNSYFEEVRSPSFKDRLAFNTRLSCFLASRVTTVSNAVAHELISLGISEAKVLVRHNVRPEFMQADESRDSVRERLGLRDGDVVFVTVGHAVPVKGWDILVRAFQSIAGKHPNARLVLVGSYTASSERNTFEALNSFVADRQLQERVIFTGRIQNVQNILGAGDVYVHPSRSEGFSNALIEAVHAGLPCISANVGDAERLIEPNVNGLLFERCNEAALADALDRLASDRDLTRKMAANARLPEWMPTVAEYAERILRDMLDARPKLAATAT